MRQVPHYLLIGNGRIARHLRHYLTLLDLPFATWHRAEPISTLEQKAATASHILLLISDQSIEPFIKRHLTGTDATLVHFSGNLVSAHAHGTHPLMTFADTLYDLECYRSVPFITDADAPAFNQLLPGLPNTHFRLDKTLKPKYHALCVMAGNFSSLLWQKLFSAFEQELGLPGSIANPYLLKMAHNLATNPNAALTGPLVRGDTQTIQNNLTALSKDPFQPIYQSFVDCYQRQQEEPT